MAGLNAEVGEHVNRSLANCNGGQGARVRRPEYCHGRRSKGRVCGTPPVLQGQRPGDDDGFKGGVQHPFTQCQFEMAGIVDISEAENGQGFDVKMNWIGFDEGESLWEPLAIIWTAPRSLLSRSSGS